MLPPISICILGGADPTELPMQRSFELVQVINLKSAKALGARLPRSLSGRRRGDRIGTLYSAKRWRAAIRSSIRYSITSSPQVYLASRAQLIAAHFLVATTA